MSPTLVSGQVLVSMRVKNYRKGDVIILRTKQAGNIVKRISAINNGLISVCGDNKNLESSLCYRSYGQEDVVGKMVFKVPKILLQSWFLRKSKT